jgi:hypothetical protein
LSKQTQVSTVQCTNAASFLGDMAMTGLVEPLSWLRR